MEIDRVEASLYPAAVRLRSDCAVPFSGCRAAPCLHTEGCSPTVANEPTKVANGTEQRVQATWCNIGPTRRGAALKPVLISRTVAFRASFCYLLGDKFHSSSAADDVGDWKEHDGKGKATMRCRRRRRQQRQHRWICCSFSRSQ